MTERVTELTIEGVHQTIRTALGGKVRTVKQLEAAHTKAVKGALEAARRARVEARYADLLPTDKGAQEATERTRDFYTDKGRLPLEGYAARQVESAADNYRRRAQAQADKYLKQALKEVRLQPCPYQELAKLRAPHPPVKYTDTIPDHLLEFHEGENNA